MNRKSKASRFPVARIKKIMQMDEEVGKLASATPVMISKSLECFMQLLLDETCKETRERGSRKLTAHHLKQTILTRPTLDFLLPVVASIPDPTPAQDEKPKAGRKAPASTRKKPASGARKAKASEEDGYGGDSGFGAEAEGGPSTNPQLLPNIGTWRRDMEGKDGSGEGGRGMFDDYEDEDDDY